MVNWRTVLPTPRSTPPRQIHLSHDDNNDDDINNQTSSTSPLLPTSEANPRNFDAVHTPARTATIIALRLKHQLEAVIPCELGTERVVAPYSNVITRAVVETARSAGGHEHRACVVFCLLVARKWFALQAKIELWDADLLLLRAEACEVIAKRIIEEEEDMDYLMIDVLLNRYSILVDGKESTPVNVVEKAVDLNALRVIGSSGYQKTISYLWRGWLVQNDDDPVQFIPFENKANTSYWAHVDPDRMRVPIYQNAVQVVVSIIYLGLFTGAINTINPTGDLDVVEGLLYIFTVGFIADEAAKLRKIGIYYIQFWNIFNATLYSLLIVSFVLRMVALIHEVESDQRYRFNSLSYYFLACTAPLFWGRLLLFLDTIQFLGTMVIIIARMMKESLIFFALLFVILIGFLQAFLGLDQVDEQLTAVGFVTKAMLNAIMTSPDFDGFDNYAPPFGLILYYIYTFVVMVVLLNVLVALYNSAYSDTTDNATDEYLALFARKTMQFVRAPDENVFIAPFNLIEIFCLVLPFEWWISHDKYEAINDAVMAILYLPVLIITAAIETRDAHNVKFNRKRRLSDDDTIEEWEQLNSELDFENDGWAKKVEETKPNVETALDILELKALRVEIKDLKELVEKILATKESKNENSDKS